MRYVQDLIEEYTGACWRVEAHTISDLAELLTSFIASRGSSMPLDPASLPAGAQIGYLSGDTAAALADPELTLTSLFKRNRLYQVYVRSRIFSSHVLIIATGKKVLAMALRGQFSLTPLRSPLVICPFGQTQLIILNRSLFCPFPTSWTPGLNLGFVRKASYVPFIYTRLASLPTHVLHFFFCTLLVLPSSYLI